jgi:GDPmannose 4,6-dehydratase
MWAMLQQDEPGDYVLATGEMHSVREFAEIAGGELGFELGWRGAGAQEIGVDRKSGRTVVKVDQNQCRAADIASNVGSAKKAQKKLGWSCKVDVKQPHRWRSPTIGASTKMTARFSRRWERAAAQFFDAAAD